MKAGFRNIAFTLIVCLPFVPFTVYSQELFPIKLSEKLWHDQQLELRYRPDGRDFVIINGNRLFTRALYGTNSAFRVETGDRPEFALYMPGMGGNFKLGIAVNNHNKWLTQANKITTRYRPGSMIYTIEDSLLGKGKLEIVILALADADGFVMRTKFENSSAPIELYWTFGGATGRRFSRDGDMGPDPESNFYLKPENCKNNIYSIDEKGKFNLKYGTGTSARELKGIFHPETTLKIADATQLNSPVELFQSKIDSAAIIVGKITVRNNEERFISIYNPSTKKSFDYNDLSSAFQQADKARQQLAGRIIVSTPDPYINTIGGALSIAADAIWEAPTYLHGSIGWRMRLNGWRGAYTADVLGWHDRAKTHFDAYASSQVTNPASIPVLPDTAMHLSRSTEKLGIGMFSDGYISRDPNGSNLRAHHYDMNLVYIDQLLRHFDWTGDTAFMRKTWPVIKRHLDWEVRNFDADKNDLFDAYAAIWASDALQYSGGDVTHSSAYNYLAFKKAAQIANMLGEDPAPYQQKAEKILEAANKVLWLHKKGTFAEFKDALGNKLLHPSAAIWTIYHSVDSEVPDKFQSYQMMRYVDNEIPHIPIKAKGLKDSGYFTVSTTSWMPYMWSLNNVALAESMHLILANWQAGRTDEAFKLFKSEVLQSMYLGGSPGNIVQISRFDAVRGEAYRDFADPIGMFSRALVEGLFGIVPDALNKTLTIRPGLPSSWTFASFSTPDISFDFKRASKQDNYTLEQNLPISLALKFQVIAQGQVQSVSMDGKTVQWKNVNDAVGRPVIEINLPAAKKYNLSIVWKAAKPVLPSKEKTYVTGNIISENFPSASVLKVYDPQTALTEIKTSASGFKGKINTCNGNYTVFIQLRQGSLSWWMPICFKVKDPIEVIQDPEAISNGIYLQNNLSQNIIASLRVNDLQLPFQLNAEKRSAEIGIPLHELLPGTNKVTINLSNGTIINSQIVNWYGKKQSKQEPLVITSHFNDKVTRIFQNKYLSPRPNATTLQLPWQGIGDWPHPLDSFDVDDSGLRKLAGDKNEIVLPQGISFVTPGSPNANNILFTSQWDNYPKERSIELTGKAAHVWFLMAGSTNPMQSQLTNGIIQIEYADGSKDSLILRNPETWWPIDQDYYTDGFAFSLKMPRPIRVHLKTGEVVGGESSKKKFNGKKIPGGAATVLDMPLDPTKTLKSLTLKTVANDVVIGLMGITLSRPE